MAQGRAAHPSSIKLLVWCGGSLYCKIMCWRWFFGIFLHIQTLCSCNTWLELRVQDVFYWFLHKHPTTKRKHSSIKSRSQHISIHSISYVWSNFTNRNGGNFSKAALSSYKLVDNLEATMIAICYQKHRIAFIEASFWNQTFIQLNKQKRFSRSIFIPHIR